MSKKRHSYAFTKLLVNQKRAELLVDQELCMYRIEREYHQQARNSFPRWLHILRKETKMQKRTRWNFSRNRSETDQLSSKLSAKLSLENPAQLLHMATARDRAVRKNAAFGQVW